MSAETPLQHRFEDCEWSSMALSWEKFSRLRTQVLALLRSAQRAGRKLELTSVSELLLEARGLLTPSMAKLLLKDLVVDRASGIAPPLNARPWNMIGRTKQIALLGLVAGFMETERWCAIDWQVRHAFLSDFNAGCHWKTSTPSSFATLHARPVGFLPLYATELKRQRSVDVPRRVAAGSILLQRLPQSVLARNTIADKLPVLPEEICLHILAKSDEPTIRGDAVEWMNIYGDSWVSLMHPVTQDDQGQRRRGRRGRRGRRAR